MGEIQKIQMVAKTAFEKLYRDRVTITTIEMVFDENSGSKKQVKTTTDPVACKLDYTAGDIPVQSGHSYGIETDYILYISPDVLIKEGSILEVTLENGLYFSFGISGTVRHYPTHNEYPLVSKKKVL